MCDFLSKIDFCIKTYLRPRACENLVASIRRFYPEAHITTNSHPEIHTGRNALVKGTKRPYLLFLDDDFLFTEETRVEKLFHCVAGSNSKRLIAGGVVMDVARDGSRCPRNSGGVCRIRADYTLEISRAVDSIWPDILPNFFMAPRGLWDECQWRFGIGAEHADFFMQAKAADWLVMQLQEVKINHDLNAPADPGYKAARWNISANVLAFMNHWDIDTVLVNGKVAHNRLPFAMLRPSEKPMDVSDCKVYRHAE